MNERIKKLEKQCWDNQTNHLNSEKFVELILTEVTDILSTYRTRLTFENGFEYNCEHPIIAIRKHFGVEE